MGNAMLRFGAALLALATAGCVQRVVTVSPNQAAELSEQYHDRVVVRGVRGPDDQLHPIVGVVVDDGAYLVTSTNRKYELHPDDRLQVRIDYVDGDRAWIEGGTVHKGASTTKIVGGLMLSVAGWAGLAGSIAAANCGPRSYDDGFGAGFAQLGEAFCALGWSLVGGAAISAGVAESRSSFAAVSLRT